MKMIIVIVKDSEAEPITQALTTNDFRVTRIARQPPQSPARWLLYLACVRV